MAKKAKPVEFYSCVCIIEFVPSENVVRASKVHRSADGSVIASSGLDIPLNSNSFDSAMQIATSFASNVGLIEYEDQ